MPFADRCHLKIPFPSWARDNNSQPERDFENWKELQRWADDFYTTCLPKGGSGGVPTLFAASANATDKSKSYADVVCSGTNDDVDLNALFDIIGTDWGGRVFLSEGDFNLTAPVVLGYGQSIEGLRDATFLQVSATTGVLLGDYGFVRDISFIGPGGSSVAVDVQTSYGTVEGCVFEGWGTCVQVGAFHSHNNVLNNRMLTSPVAVRVEGDSTLIQGNYMNSELRIASGARSLVLGNRFGSASTAEIHVDASATSACFSDNFMSGAGAARFIDLGANTQRGTNFSDGGTW